MTTQFATSISSSVATIATLQGVPTQFTPDLMAHVAPASGSPDYWGAALTLGRYYNQPELNEPARQHISGLIGEIRNYQGQLAATSEEPTTVVFGTSGWRDRIGEGFTNLNVRKTVRGIIDMMHTNDFYRVNGYTSFADVQNAGIVLLRDNRFMGDEFMAAAQDELVTAGINVYMAGECPTGVGSAVVTELGAAGSINFTPSHNPMDYAGIKFNPADGGPAAKELTSLIEQHANGYMPPDAIFTRAWPESAKISRFSRKVNAQEIYKTYLEHTNIFDLPSIRKWLLANKDDVQLVVDFMHGSSRGYIEALLGDEVVSQLMNSGSLVFMHTEDDPSFHGIKPEPSAANQQPIIDTLAQSGRKLTLGVFMDPDADRIRFADATMDISMNLFGAIAFADAMEHNTEGGIASTVASSGFAFEIARQNNRPVFETPVGFKFFRPSLTSSEALVAFEESDGISFGGHTLEKDAIAGFLAALSTMVRSNQNLSTQYKALQERYGYFYPRRDGVDVNGVTTDEWQAYKGNVLQALQKGLVKKGDFIGIDGKQKLVTDVITKDGLKIVFDDRSWLLMRPSGTEPKFRIYIEPVSSKPIENIEAVSQNYLKAGATILNRARAKVDQD